MCPARRKVRNLAYPTIATDDRGSIFILAAFLIVPLAALAGGAVDLVRMSFLETRLQSSIDSAALSAASLTNEQELNAVIDEYIAINLGRDHEQITNLNIKATPDVQETSRKVTITASGGIETYFLKLIGIDELQISAATTAGQSIQAIEISLVLDISSSMNGSRLTNLRSAATAFVNEMLGDDTLGTTTINLVPYGGTVNVGNLFDTYAPGLDEAIVDPTEAQYTGVDVADGNFRFSDGLKCLEYRDDDFNDDVLSFNSRSQVPHFWKWWPDNPWCPNNENSALFNSNDAVALTDIITNFSLSDGTGTDIGMLWGLKALSPKWQGLLGGDKPDRPALFDDDETLKVIVLMTDGGTTFQARPEDTSLNSVHTNGKNNENQQFTINKNDARENLKLLCDSAKENRIVVFSIGFQITPASFQEKDLQYCASGFSHYYLVETLDIANAFESIAVSIGALRLTH